MIAISVCVGEATFGEHGCLLHESISLWNVSDDVKISMSSWDGSAGDTTFTYEKD
jgi:hypothetical protein